MPVYLDDKRLSKQLLAGDEQAFSRFFDENFARLYRFASARLPPDPDAVREVVHGALSLAMQKIHLYRGEAALFTWLCAICRNEISDWLRQHDRYREHIVLMEDSPEIQAAVDSIHAAADDDPEKWYRRVEKLRLIQIALDRLPARYGDVLEWKYIEGQTVREIAGRLGIGTEAAQSLLARAKRAFADVYGSLVGTLNENEGLLKL